MSYLVDTNVISELRKGDRCNGNVSIWWSSVDDDDIFLSVLTIGEIRKGIENIRLRDQRAAFSIQRWLRKLTASYGSRIIPVGAEVADEWGRLNVPDPLPVIDSLLAATAKVHHLTLVSRNIRDVERTGALLLNPFEEPS